MRRPIAKYLAEGIPATLVCCTGGECGDILNPAMDRPEVREHLAEVRRAELDASVAAIGYDRLDLLGYRDSGMPDTPENARAGQLLERSARRGGRASGGDHPA